MLQVEHSLELRRNRVLIGSGREDQFIKLITIVARELKPVTETSSKVDRSISLS